MSVSLTGESTRRAIWGVALFAAAFLAVGSGSARAADSQEEATGGATQEGGQSRESMANDSSASQWSYQLAWEGRTWRDDVIGTDMNGDPITRPEGNRDMWQFRIVAPLTPEMTGLSFPILPRLTLRNNEAVDKSSGAGDAELFAMIVPKEWSTGRFGIGPQVNFPADDPKFGSSVWRLGFATAVLQRAVQDKALFGLLVQQIWGATQPNSDAIVAQPITIQPVFNYALPKAFYLNIGETAFSYDWRASAWLVPIGLRVGRLWINERSTFNFYLEYRTTVVYEDWPGSALQDAFRINLSYTVPVG